MLRREIAEMTAKVRKAESTWQSRCDAQGYVEPPERLVVVRQRIAEMARMLDALNSRFPRRA